MPSKWEGMGMRGGEEPFAPALPHFLLKLLVSKTSLL